MSESEGENEIESSGSEEADSEQADSEEVDNEETSETVATINPDKSEDDNVSWKDLVILFLIRS